MTFISLSLSPLSLSPLSPPPLSLLSCNYSDPTLLYFYPTGFKGFLYFTQF
jgi:hypothetical protein